VWHEEQHCDRRHAPVPDGDAVEPVKRALDRRQDRGEHERARQEQDCLGTEELPDVATCRLVRRLREQPEQHVPG
jgi:hypothetical protein